MADDPFALKRFLDAQAGAIDTALQELRAGKKRSHWMWFVFPQLKGLGSSPTAAFYGIASRQEAQAYLDHPLLNARLKAAVLAAEASSAPSLRALFGSPDDLKFCSSMTLFAEVSGADLYQGALDRWCDGERDVRTLCLLAN